jgi:hypothetical protein
MKILKNAVKVYIEFYWLRIGSNDFQYGDEIS